MAFQCQFQIFGVRDCVQLLNNMLMPSYGSHFGHSLPPFLVIKKEKRKRDCPTPTIQHSLLGLLVQSDRYGVFLIILPREGYCLTYYLIRMIHERIFQSTLLFVLCPPCGCHSSLKEGGCCFN